MNTDKHRLGAKLIGKSILDVLCFICGFFSSSATD
jgi:hypothetical protein